MQHTGLKIVAKDEAASVWIYDEIGFWGITASAFAKELQAVKSAKNITVMINSPGGDVFDGLAIYNSLLKHGAEIAVEIDGVAASIASIIAMAGDTVKIADNGSIMVHNPWTMAVGEAKDMRKTADTLDMVRGQLINTYAKKTGSSIQEIGDLMDAETWMTASDAMEQGFADEVIGEQRLAASAMQKEFRKQIPPKNYLPPEDRDEVSYNGKYTLPRLEPIALRELDIRIAEATL